MSTFRDVVRDLWGRSVPIEELARERHSTETVFHPAEDPEPPSEPEELEPGVIVDRPHDEFAPVLRLGDDEQYRRNIIAALYSEHGPEWLSRAACAGEDEPRDWSYTDRFFTDEVSDARKLVFPETVYRAMKTCSDCPVRRECLEQAYEQEQSYEPIPGTAPVRYAWVENSDRYGIRGGVPGQIRQRYAKHPKRLEACERWFGAVARKRKWGMAAVMERLWNPSPPEERRHA